MPVFPAVPSTMTPPGRRSPRVSASRTMPSAARSLTEPPGFMNSALPRISQPVCSDAARSRIRGVSPMASRTVPRTLICVASFLMADSVADLMAESGQLVGLVFVGQRHHDLVQVSRQDVFQAVESQVDAVVRDPSLRKIVSADALRAVA